MNPAHAHPVPPDGGLPSGDLPLVEPVRELRGFPLGTILLRLGLVPEGPINEALAECESARKPLGRFLVERGMLEESELSRALAIQKGLPFVQLEQVAVDARAVGLLSPHMANTLGALPLGYVGAAPVVAVGDPTKKEAIDEICAAIGGEVLIAAAAPARLKEAIFAAYRQADAPAPVVPIAAPPPVVPIAAAPTPAATPAPAEPESSFRVVASVGLERVEIARCPTRAAAHERAQGLVAELASGAWIPCGDRLLRADAVVAVEILEASSA